MITIPQLINEHLPVVLTDITYSYINPYIYKGLDCDINRNQSCAFCKHRLKYALKLVHNESKDFIYSGLDCYKKLFGIYKKGGIKVPKHYLAEAKVFTPGITGFINDEVINRYKYQIRHLAEILTLINTEPDRRHKLTQDVIRPCERCRCDITIKAHEKDWRYYCRRCYYIAKVPSHKDPFKLLKKRCMVCNNKFACMQYASYKTL